jgi:hypothetical protein
MIYGGMAAPKGRYTPRWYDARLDGHPPFSLQRACELEAAFNVFACGRWPTQATWWRERLTLFTPHELHGAVGRILQFMPSRRQL